MFQSCSVEAQDVLASSANVDLIELEATASFSFLEHWLRRLSWKDFTGRLMRINPGLKAVRLEREYDLSIILTAPSVQYRLIMQDNVSLTIDNPSLYPDPMAIQGSMEPYIKASIIVPDRYMGAVRRGWLSVGRLSEGNG